MSNGNKRLKKVRALMEPIAEMKDGRRAPIYIGKMKKTGKIAAIVVRNSDQIFRGNATTMTEARYAGTLCWMMDASLISYMQDIYGIELLITLERNSGDMWLSKIEDWQDSEKLYQLEGAALARRTYRGMANSYLPVHHMVHLPGEVSLLSGVRGAR